MHRQLIQLLAVQGQRGAALKAYEACRRLLVHELGVEPSGETMTLYQRIRDELSDRGPEGPKYVGAIEFLQNSKENRGT